jgi:hypothetical protein
MHCRTVWSIAGCAGAGLLIFGLGTMWAQRPVEPPRPGIPPFMQMPGFGGPMQGRFAVAHATEKRIVILDTATGKLYQAKESDLLPFSDLPKVGEPGRAPRGDGPDRPRRRNEEERERKDKAKLRELEDSRLRPGRE